MQEHVFQANITLSLRRRTNGELGRMWAFFVCGRRDIVRCITIIMIHDAIFSPRTEYAFSFISPNMDILFMLCSDISSVSADWCVFSHMRLWLDRLMDVRAVRGCSAIIFSCKYKRFYCNVCEKPLKYGVFVLEIKLFLLAVRSDIENSKRWKKKNQIRIKIPHDQKINTCPWTILMLAKLVSPTRRHEYAFVLALIWISFIAMRLVHWAIVIAAL